MLDLSDANRMFSEGNIPPVVQHAVEQIAAERAACLASYACVYKFVTESPIEWALLLAIIEQGTLGGAEVSLATNETLDDYLKRDSAIVIVPQMRIGKYRLDFLMFRKTVVGLSKLNIECDGHDFHERTKEQAARDKQRDRHLVSSGIPVIRYAGSEIYKDPNGCANNAIDTLMQIHHGLYGEGF